MWFNPTELSKNKTDCLATPATLRLSEEEIIKTAIQSRKVAKVAEVEEQKKIIVTCYTPAGNPIEVEARDAEHTAWLKQMNPKRKL